MLISKHRLFDEITQKIEKLVTRTRLDESSPKNAALYFSLLSETKDLLNATMNLVEIFDKHSNAAASRK